VLSFLKRNYATNEIVVSSVGAIDFSKLVRAAEDYFGYIPAKKSNGGRVPYRYDLYTPSVHQQENGTHQVHCIIGSQAYHGNDTRRFAVHLLNAILGGPNLNSRLNMSLREKKGFAYHVESMYTTYSDVGIVEIYFGADKSDSAKCIDLINKELYLLRTKKLGVNQLVKAKRQLLGQIAIAAESNENLMVANAKSMMLFDRIDSFEQIREAIDAITADQLLEVANEVYEPSSLSMLMFS
jgi:predicted Zn-dependent peptidase